MRLTALKSINNSVIGNMKKTFRINFKDTPKYIESVVKPEHKDAVYKKINDINHWYTRIVGLDKVKLAQDKVTTLQDQLRDLQEKRREVGRQLADVRAKSNELQDQIHKVNRQDDIQRFLALMKEETEVSKLEHEIQLKFQEYDHAEREIFTEFANAIRDSHEKQRAQLEYTKYFGLIFSIVGSFLAFCYTNFRKRDLKIFLENSMGAHSINSEQLKSYLESSDKKLETIVQCMSKKNMRALEFISNNTEQLKALLSNNAVNEVIVAGTKKESNIRPGVKVSKDESSLILNEPYTLQERRIIRYILYAGLGILILKILSPN